MNINQLQDALAGIPYMRPDQGQEIYTFILQHRLANCLELGFAHGVGTAYMASAASQIGGKVTAIDLEIAKQGQPDIMTVLKKAEVRPETVEIFFEPSSYTWRMMKFMDEGRSSTFDFVYIDGAHSWAVDGFAFFLAEKLLRPGGWILFDDLNWRFDDPGMPESLIKQMTIEERTTPQVRKIWELLVKTSDKFDSLDEKGGWGYARKSLNQSQQTVLVRYHPIATSLIDFKNYAVGKLKRRKA